MNVSKKWDYILTKRKGAGTEKKRERKSRETKKEDERRRERV